MATPRFSVLVAVYNAGVFVEQTVRSVLAQTCGDLELILIDDGSTDGCLGFLAGATDSRIQVLRQANQGAPAAINTGLHAAVGEWVALLDHDDLWLPGKLEAHRQCVETHPETDLTFNWSRSIDENGNDLHLNSRPWRGTISFAELLDDFVIGNTSAIVMRRSAIERAGIMNVALPRVYDFDACLRVAALRAGNCRSVPEYLTCYRRHAGQMSCDWRTLQGEWEHLLRLVPSYAPCPVERRLGLADSNMRRYFAWIACQAGDGPSALRLALSAFRRAPRRAPFDLRNWLMLAACCGRCALPDAIYRSTLEAGKRVFGR